MKSTVQKTDFSHLGTPLVSGPRLLEILFEESSRPTLRWLQMQQRKGLVPFKRLNGKTLFDPAEVRAAFDRRTVNA